MDTVTFHIRNKEKGLVRECMADIRQLRQLLGTIECRVEDSDATLNDLGELQSLPGILDCKLASLGVVRRILASDYLEIRNLLIWP